MPAVFVHGVPDTGAVWRPLIDCLDRPDCITVELPGFGSPAPKDWAATKEAYVDWLVAEIEAIGEPVDLVSHDWGAILAQHLLSVRPDLVRTFATSTCAIDEDYVWHDMAQLWQTPEVGEQLMAAPIAPELLVAAGMTDEYAAVAAGAFDDEMKRCVLALYRSAVTVGAEWAPSLAAHSRPALVVNPGADPYIPPQFGPRLASRLGATLLDLDGCPHWWQLHRIDEVARALGALWATPTR